MTLSLFAVTAPGLEKITQQEMQMLGFSQCMQADNGTVERGGISFQGSLSDLYRANLNLRTASRILARLGEFYAVSFPELVKKAARLPWEEYLMPGQPLALRVTCHKSRLYHSDGVAERVAAAVSKKLGKPSKIMKLDEEGDLPPQLVVVRLLNDLCTISLDSSGALLHRRGYRLETAKAPLRETLAAGLLLASNWDQQSPLLDPFCGSGTIPIEAARLARRISPGSERHFAFMDWRGFDSQSWEKILQETVALERPCEAILHASDRDAGAIRSAQENAKRARVAENIHFECKAFSSLQSGERAGWLITNPPYGVRIQSNSDIRNLYSSLGNVLRKNCQGWRFGILCASEELMGYTRLKVEQTLSLVNGGVRVKFSMGLVE